MAVTRTWTTFGSGSFNTAANWFPAGIPNSSDFVSFEVGAGLNYTVTFPGNFLGDPVANYSTSHLRLRADTVTFSGSTQAGRGPSTYSVASTTQSEANRGIIIGVLSSDNAVLNVRQPGIVCCGGVSSLNAVAATIGDGAGATGTLNMSTGAFNVTGSDFTQTQLIVGNNGTGTLNVNSGTRVNVTGFNSRTSLGHYASGVGVVNINGAGATWTSNNELWVGESGSGTLTIQNGGSLITNGQGGTASSIIGTFPGANGMVTVTGAGSTWTNGASFRVGNSGNGTLVISNGGQLIHNNPFAPIEIGSGSSGVATVTGSGSSWTTPGTIYIGSTGTGALAIQNGGSLTSGSGLIRGLNSGSGEVLVAGAGSFWSVTSGPLTIGLSEPGFSTGPTALTINPGGSVNVAANIDLNANSTLRLQGGTLDSTVINLQAGGQFQWNAGTLHVVNFNGSLVNQGGTLAPGHSAGETIVLGNYTQQASGKLEIQIGGIESGTQHDFLGVMQTGLMGGTLELDLINGFVPDPNDSFRIMEAAGIQGSFANAANGQRLFTSDGSGSFQVHYGVGSQFDPNQVVLSDFMAGLLGDFNSDGVYDCADVDGLVGVIAANTNLTVYDLNGNGLVNQEDLNVWLATAGGVNNPSGGAYRAGDANLDGVVDGQDFLAWNTNKFMSVAAWCSGDFTADGVVDGSDFVVWNSNKFTSSDSASQVPEPVGMISLVLALPLFTRRLAKLRKY